MPKPHVAPPIIVITGEDEHLKVNALTKALDRLLPPSVDRGLALTEYDGSRPAEEGGPMLAAVLENLATLPFLADRRVVVIRDADEFITGANRAKLETYLTRPSPTGTLVLECRTFSKGTRLYKAASAVGEIIECMKLKGQALSSFVLTAATARGKRIDPAAAAKLIDLTGPAAGALTEEIEKLALYVGDRPTITAEDVAALVGMSREEKIFATVDAAALGRLPDALRLWHQVLASDAAAAYRAIGGVAYKVRSYLAAHALAAEGLKPFEIVPRVNLWGRERDLETILRRLSPHALRRLLAALALLDTQAKLGLRSIDTGIELLLAQTASLGS